MYELSTRAHFLSGGFSRADFDFGLFQFSCNWRIYNCADFELKPALHFENKNGSRFGFSFRLFFRVKARTMKILTL